MIRTHTHISVVIWIISGIFKSHERNWSQWIQCESKSDSFQMAMGSTLCLYSMLFPLIKSETLWFHWIPNSSDSMLLFKYTKITLCIYLPFEYRIRFGMHMFSTVLKVFRHTRAHCDGGKERKVNSSTDKGKVNRFNKEMNRTKKNIE